jgi:hypothetical protein
MQVHNNRNQTNQGVFLDGSVGCKTFRGGGPSLRTLSIASTQYSQNALSAGTSCSSQYSPPLRISVKSLDPDASQYAVNMYNIAS